MIALGYNTYKTLDDKFYIGNTQVGKVYLGDTLIYPSIYKIDDIEISLSPQPTNGMVYDTKYAPTKNTRFELCLTAKDMPPNGFTFFGTQHDTKVTPCYFNYRNSNGSKGNYYNNMTSDSTGWTSYYEIVAPNYKNKTKFSVGYGIFGGTALKTTFRYGGPQDRGGGENTNDCIVDNNKPYFATYTDNDKFQVGKNLGPYYYSSIGETFPTTGVVTNNIYNSDYSSSDSGGNLWINGVNRFMTNPNLNRPLDNVNTPPHYDDNNDNVIVNSYNNKASNQYIQTSSSTYHYLILWEKGDESSRVIYVPKTTEYTDSNGNKIVVFEKHTSYLNEHDNKYHFNTEVSEIIYPFLYCRPEVWDEN